jgi:hypothetical protein
MHCFFFGLSCLRFFLTCAGETYACLWDFQLSHPCQFPKTETQIACYLTAFLADSTVCSSKLSTTDVTFPRDYVFILLHNEKLTGRRACAPIPCSAWLSTEITISYLIMCCLRQEDIVLSSQDACHRLVADALE